MISQELAEEVLGHWAWIVPKEHIRWDTIKKENDIVYEKKNELRYTINIHELAHKCKEWAITKGYMISSRYIFDFKKYRALIYYDDGIGESCEVSCISMEDSEPEAIFKACQWILDNKCSV